MSSSHSSHDVTVCLKCGKSVDGGARLGLCMECLFVPLALEEWPLGDTDSEQAEERSKGEWFGEYEILEELGRGGMGIVYRARQTSLNRFVAVKLLLAGALAGPGFINRLKSEATSAGALSHPNIVPVHHFGLHEGQHFLVMDYVPGLNLARRISNQPWGALRASTLLVKLSEAIHYAHEKGILHRDLKPSNILMDETDDPRITDFGLATRIETGEEMMEFQTRLTLTGETVGSPNYMPPEQVSAKVGAVGRPSDVYSLGGILYHLLTGRPPFLAKTLHATLHQVLETEPVSPRLINPTVPLDLETICLKCLSKAPSRRYQTAEALAQELTRFINGDPILARPVGNLGKALRWARKRPALAISIGGTVALLIVLGVGSNVAMRRISKLGEESEKARKLAEISERKANHQLFELSMNLAPQAWDQKDYVRLSRLLDQSDSPAEGSFAWRFWRRQFHFASRVRLAHAGAVRAMAYSPNGLFLATAGEDRIIRIWKSDSLESVAELHGHEGSITSIAWLPDNSQLVSGADDHSIRLWDVATGKQMQKLFDGRTRVGSLALSRDGGLLASGHQDGAINLWNLRQGTRRQLKTAFSNEIPALAFSPLNKQLAIGGADSPVFLWNLEKDQQDLKFPRQIGEIQALAFSKDGAELAGASDDRKIYFWNATHGNVTSLLQGHSDSVRSLHFASDGTKLASGSEDATVRIWTPQQGRAMATLNFQSGKVFATSFSPDDKWLAAGGSEGSVRIWPMDVTLESLDVKSHTNSIWSVAISPDGKILATGGWDGSLHILETMTGRDIRKIAGHAGSAWGLAFSPEGERMASVGEDGLIRIWEISTGKVIQQMSIGLSPEMSVAFSPDGQELATGTRDGKLSLWSPATGHLQRTIDAHTDCTRAIAYSADGKQLATASWDGTAKIWERFSGRVVSTFRGHEGPLLSVSFSPDGSRVVTGSTDRTARIWDPVTARELLRLNGHRDAINTTEFLRSGKELMTSGGDQTVRIWSALDGQELLLLPSNGSPVLAACMDAADQQIVAGTDSGHVLVWRAASADEMLRWKAEEEASAKQSRLLLEEASKTEQKKEASRAIDPGFPHHWLTLLPIPFTNSVATGVSSAPLDVEYLLREAELQPRDGDRVTVGGMEFTWKPTVEKGVIDFNRVAGLTREQVVGYAVAYIESKNLQRDVRLWVGSDDQCKIYLNGVEVFKWAHDRGFIEDEHVVEGLALKPGRNVVVFKVTNGAADWKGSLRFTSASGGFIEGREPGPTPR